uniref:Uncharacterized protein n=1 Tax=Romanomermis culicivorax TaxID=13658 RepID=A0A915ISM1_ROMCU
MSPLDTLAHGGIRPWATLVVGHISLLATLAHWPHEPIGHISPLATLTHWPHKPIGHISPLATLAHSATLA